MVLGSQDEFQYAFFPFSEAPLYSYLLKLCAKICGSFEKLTLTSIDKIFKIFSLKIQQSKDFSDLLPC